MPITLRSAKGAPLTHAEMDANWGVVNLLTAALVTTSVSGAVGNGVANDTTPISTVMASNGIKVLGYGDYYTPGSVTAFTRPTLILADNAKGSGTYIPFISITNSDVGFKSLPQTYVFIWQSTTDRSDAITMRVDRIVNTDDGHTNPKALRVYTQKNNSNDSTEWAFSAELDNYSNIASTGDAALSGVANKYGTASTFAGHLQVKDWNKYAAPTDVTAIVGLEINTPAVGLDHPTANNNSGNRRSLDLIARTNEDVVGWTDAEHGVGASIRTDNLTDGYYRIGLLIDDVTQSGNPNPITTAALIRTSGPDGLQIKGKNTGAALRIEPTTAGAFGLRINGDFGTGSIGVDTGNWITLSDDDTRKLRYGAGEEAIEFWTSSNRRFYFRINASPAMYINDVKVLGTRETGWTAMTGTSDKATAYDTSTITLPQLAGRVMALQAQATTHGLIGA